MSTKNKKKQKNSQQKKISKTKVLIKHKVTKPVKPSKEAKKEITKKVKKKLVSRKIVNKKTSPKKNLKQEKKSEKKLHKGSTVINKLIDKKSQSKTSKNSIPEKKTVVVNEEVKAIVLSARKRTATPAIFKIRSKKNTPVVFTLEDVKEIISTRKSNDNQPLTEVTRSNQKTTQKSLIEQQLQNQKARVLGAASLSDILGFNPKNAKPVTAVDEEASKIPEKYKRYYKLLVELRNHIKKEMDWHAQDTLGRSSKEDTGDLSSYSQHMADAGTDTFDRDFALSVLSNEQDALYEIDEAIQRMMQGTYGVCEVTGQPIAKERLIAVPFTRCSLEGQQNLERNKRRISHRTSSVGVFSEAFDDESAAYGEEDDSSDT